MGCKNMTNELLSAIIFIVGLVISTIIIYITTKLLGQKEGIGRAFVTALIGTVVYFVVYLILGDGLIASVVGGIIWLVALRVLYNIGWLKALVIAVIVWITATIIGFLLPTVPGPL
jgi:L-lactate permease